MKRPALFFAVLIALLLTGYGLWWKLHPVNPQAIQALGGKTMSVRLPEGSEKFLQRDPKWADDKVGKTNETLGEVGCLVCSVAMAANALGENTTPKELNAALTKDGGYTREGWLVWSKVGPAFGHRVETVVAERPSHAEIDQALQNGERPIVKVLLFEMIPHWVPVIGKESMDYLVRDPLQDVKEPVRLSELAGKIESVRYLRKAVR